MSGEGPTLATFLMTDVERSTILWEEDPASMSVRMRRHDEILDRIVPEFGGEVVKGRGEGDSSFCVFASPADAVLAAWQVLQLFGREPWAGKDAISVRMALHTGECEARSGDYYGPTVNRCARLRASCSGGRILLSQATKLLVEDHLPPHTRLKDHGNHMLKDLLRPERIYELLAIGNDPDHPPLRTLNRTLHNLPVQLTSFVGRRGEMELVRTLLDANRWVSLLGVGGTGKTRLSLQLGAELADQFEDGVWQAELATAAGIDRVYKAVGHALSAQEEPGRDWIEVLGDAIQSRRMLLILDNCEQIAEEACLLCEQLLTVAPNLKIVTTSREELRGQGEHPYRVPPLGLPPNSEEAPIDELLASEAVQLFADRAASQLNDFRVGPDNARAVADICRRLAGIPLAIEHVAANLSTLSPHQILARWEDRFAALASHQRHPVPRHETLRSCFDWSFELLEPQESELFRRLAVFTGGWSLEAAEAVCSAPPLAKEAIVGLLQRLISKSLVVADQEATGERRYRFLEPVRQFAVQKGGGSGLDAAHLDFFLDFAERGCEELAGPQQAAWLERLEADHDNLRAALRYSAAERPVEALSLACAMRRFWYWRGHLSEGRTWLETTLAGAPDAPEDVRATSLNALGAILTQLSLAVEARAAYEASLAIWTRLGDGGQMAAIGHNVGILLSESGAYLEALDHFEASLQEYRTLGDGTGIANSLINIGVCHTSRGEPQEALGPLTEAIEVGQGEATTAFAALAHSNLAVALHRLGRTDEGLDQMRRSLEICRDVKGQVEISGELLELGLILFDQGRFAAAAITLGAAEGTRHKLGRKLDARTSERLTPALAALNGALGDGTAKALLRQGRSMSFGVAVEHAIGVCHAVDFSDESG